MPKRKQYSAGIVGAIGIAVSAILMFSMTNAGPIEVRNNASAAQSSLTIPVRLRIPRIGVDALVERVGTTPGGAMGAPEGPSNVAWFRLGTHPGEIGSAVIDGHSGWKNSLPAVFDTLSKLQAGDLLYVENGSGATITFVVRELKIYSENNNASDIFISKDGGAHLNLITCEGVWNPVQESYSDRLVVFADKI